MYLCISAKLYELACFFIEVQRLNFWNVIIITVFSRLSTLLYILYYNITHYEFIACRLDVLCFTFFIFNKSPWWFPSLIQAVLYLDIGRSRAALKLFTFLYMALFLQDINGFALIEDALTFYFMSAIKEVNNFTLIEKLHFLIGCNDEKN